MIRLNSCFIQLFVLLSLSVSIAVAKQPITLTLKQGAPTTYTVVKGDTLWDIAGMYLNDPWLWPQLWDINDDIENPHLIYPGDQLYLVWQNGKPRLKFKPKITLSPEAKKTPKQPVPVVAQGLVLPYLKSDRLVDSTILKQSSRVLGNNEGRQYLSGVDKLYFSGHHSSKNWGVYRTSQQYLRGNQSATALRLIATGQLVGADNGMSVLQIEQQSQEVRIDDIVLPVKDVNRYNLTTTFFPHPSPINLQASIVGSLDGGKYAAKSQVVVLDRGAEDGLKQGCVFDVYSPGNTVFGQPGNVSYENSWFDTAKQLPDSKVGEMMVIRPYARFSLALITSSEAAISTDSIVLSPLIAK